MDIFQLLRKDHAEARSELAAWMRRPEGAAGAALWARWSERWEVHARIEENFLFPFLKGEPVLRRLMAEAMEAHVRIRKCIQELPSAAGMSRAWSGAVKDLSDSLERLFDLEENRMFPLAGLVLSGEDAEDLGREVQDFLRGLRMAMAADG